MEIIKENLFKDTCNPNADIFGVESEEGGSDEDNMLSMIGDAVQKHIEELNEAQRLVYEHFIEMGSGAIMEMVPNFKDNDPDPANLGPEDLDNVIEIRKIPEALRSWYEEAIEVEKARREGSEDAYDRNEGLISFNEWEENPGMLKYFETYPTPRDKFRKLGSTKQVFYDEFPEGHPDAKTINSLLSRLDVDVDDLTPQYFNRQRYWLSFAKIEDYTRISLLKLIDAIQAGKDPEDSTKEILSEIDRYWAIEYSNKALSKIKEDAVLQLLIFKHDEWSEEFNAGSNVYPKIKEFGKILFTKFRKEIKPIHWHFYKRLKVKFAPRVIVGKYDVNRCSLIDLKYLVKDTLKLETAADGTQKAKEIWTSRPFQSMADLISRGLAPSNLVSGTNEISKKVLDFISKTAEQCISMGSMDYMKQLANKLVEMQKEDRLKLVSGMWTQIWSHYRTSKELASYKIQSRRNP